MTFAEQTPDPDHFVLWHGDMEADYVYTFGQAGEAFFRALKDEGTILAAACPECDKRWLPPRIHCPSCFKGLDVDAFAPVEGPATVRHATVAREGVDGPLGTPEVLALVGFDGVEGGLLHRLLDVDPTTAANGGLAGTTVEPVLKPEGEREGLITDIEGFRPA